MGGEGSGRKPKSKLPNGTYRLFGADISICDKPAEKRARASTASDLGTSVRPDTVSSRPNQPVDNVADTASVETSETDIIDVVETDDGTGPSSVKRSTRTLAELLKQQQYKCIVDSADSKRLQCTMCSTVGDPCTMQKLIKNVIAHVRSHKHKQAVIKRTDTDLKRAAGKITPLQ